MRAKQKLILMTTNFPYGKGEEFIEAELLILCETFSVTITPIYTKGTKRATPDDIKIDTSLADKISKLSLRKLYPIGISIGFIIKHFNRAYFSILKKFIWTAHNTVLIKRWVGDYSDNFDSQTIFYTYWYDIATNGVAISKANYNKLVTRVHGYDLYEDRHRPPIIPLRSNTIKMVDNIYSISKDGKNYLEKKHAVKSVQVSRLGTQDPMACNLFSIDDKYRVVSCSYIMQVKRLDRILNAIIHLSSRVNNEIDWVHIGSGNDKLSAKAQVMINGEKPENLKISFIGHLDNKSVFEYYKSTYVDVFINMSESEGIPVSIMEAISFGIPVVAPDVGGISEIVNDNSGILLNTKPSTEAIANSLMTILKEPFPQKRERRVRARKFWEENYSATVNYSSFVKRLKE